MFRYSYLNKIEARFGTWGKSKKKNSAVVAIEGPGVGTY